MRRSWRRFKEGRPGSRFHDFYEYRKEQRQGRSAAWHVVPIGLGVLLTVGGLAIGWLPGPGGFIAIFGVALLATEFEWLAKWLDRVELWARGIFHALWTCRSHPARVAVVAGAAVIAAGVIYAASTFLL